MKQPGNSEERTGSCDPISEAEIDEALEEIPASDPLPWTLGVEPNCRTKKEGNEKGKKDQSQE